MTNNYLKGGCHEIFHTPGLNPKNPPLPPITVIPTSHFAYGIKLEEKSCLVAVGYSARSSSNVNTSANRYHIPNT